VCQTLVLHHACHLAMDLEPRGGEMLGIAGGDRRTAEVGQ
jgi:hypothetical protein